MPNPNLLGSCMKNAILGTLLGAVLITMVTGMLVEGNSACAQRTTPPWSNGSGGELIALTETVDEKYQQVTVIDPARRAMSVYHIDLKDGKITLRGVRNIHWDLEMLEFNGTSPLPQEIRGLVEQR